MLGHLLETTLTIYLIWNLFCFAIQKTKGNKFLLSVPAYLQAGSITVGMWTNTIEKGAMIMYSDEFTITGSKLGISPDESTANCFPLSSIVWLCRFPSFADRWYSSRVTSLCLLPRGNRIIFTLCDNLFRLCLCLKVQVVLETTWAWTVVLPSRLINNRVIPGCK